MDNKVRRMKRRDAASVVASLPCLWTTIGYVILQVLPLASGGVAKACLIGAGLAVCAFSTASVLTVLTYLRSHEAAVYGPELD